LNVITSVAIADVCKLVVTRKDYVAQRSEYQLADGTNPGKQALFIVCIPFNFLLSKLQIC
jgi:hypothetical protein